MSKPKATTYCHKHGEVATHKHHVTHKANGGAPNGKNIVTMCAKCHVDLHSVNGDYAQWGSTGGKTSASRLHFMRNLKQFKSMTDEQFNRWAQVYTQRQQQVNKEIKPIPTKIKPTSHTHQTRVQTSYTTLMVSSGFLTFALPYPSHQVF